MAKACVMATTHYNNPKVRLACYAGSVCIEHRTDLSFAPTSPDPHRGLDWARCRYARCLHRGHDARRSDGQRFDLGVGGEVMMSRHSCCLGRYNPSIRFTESWQVDRKEVTR